MGCQSSGKSMHVRWFDCLHCCCVGTLLNLLFSTDVCPLSFALVFICVCLFSSQFREMDATTGRGQTTRGVWFDAGKAGTDIIVMVCFFACVLCVHIVCVQDSEGTDSSERGEDRTVNTTTRTHTRTYTYTHAHRHSSGKPHCTRWRWLKC